MGRKLSHDFKFAARVPQEVHDAFALLLLKFQSAGYKFQGRKIGAEAVVGGLILDYLLAPPERQRALILERIPRLEAMLDSDELLPLAEPGTPGQNGVGTTTTLIGPPSGRPAPESSEEPAAAVDVRPARRPAARKRRTG
jgi:hypothetical protein